MTLRYAHAGDRETAAAAERIGAGLAATLAGAAPTGRRQERTPQTKL